MNGGTTDGGQHGGGHEHAGASGTGSGGTARPGDSAGAPGGGAGTRGTWAEIKGTFRDFWYTRPDRPVEGRKIAGVAAALGNRYGVDPVLLRVVFVVGTFYGGAGLLFYLLGWATLPRAGRSGGSTAARVVVLALLTVVFVPASLAAFDMPGLFGLALGALALYLLHRHFAAPHRRGQPPGIGGRPSGNTVAAPTEHAAQPGAHHWGTRADAGGTESTVPPAQPPRAPEPPETTGDERNAAGEEAPGAASPGPVIPDAPRYDAAQHGAVQHETTRYDTTEPNTAATPASVDPGTAATGVGPHPAAEPGWHGTAYCGEPPRWTPPPGQVPPAAGSPPRQGPERRGPRYSITLATLGITLLVGGFGIAFGLAAVTIWALMLGVIGCGLLAGSFLRRGRWLILFAVPVALAAMLSTVIPARPWADYTDTTVFPEKATGLESEYSGSVGSVVLGLENMRFPAEREVSTDVTLGMGTVTVYLPPETDARVTCASDLGRVNCLGSERSGRDIRVTENDLGTDGPGGGSVRLNLMAKTGSVEVIRGY